MPIDDLLRQRRLIVCVGAGGVGWVGLILFCSGLVWSDLVWSGHLISLRCVRLWVLCARPVPAHRLSVDLLYESPRRKPG